MKIKIETKQTKKYDDCTKNVILFHFIHISEIRRGTECDNLIRPEI